MIRQCPIKLFIPTLNSFQQGVHLGLQSPLYLPFVRCGQAPERRSELRRTDTHRPARLRLGSPGVHPPPSHPPRPPWTLSASSGQMMMFHGHSKLLSWLIKVCQDPELGMAQQALVLGIWGGDTSVAVAPAACVTPRSLGTKRKWGSPLPALTQQFTHLMAGGGQWDW